APRSLPQASAVPPGPGSAWPSGNGKERSGCVPRKETTWSESPFGGGLRYNENAIDSRRADRAPGRGRAGECPSSRLGLTGRFCLQVSGQLLKQSTTVAIGNWPGATISPSASLLLVGLPARFELLPPRGGLLFLSRRKVELDQPLQGCSQVDPARANLWNLVFALVEPLVAGQQQRLSLGVLLLVEQGAAEHGLGVERRPGVGFLQHTDRQALAQQ